MTLQFRTVATVSALLFFVLALTLMFAPNVLLADWGLEVTMSVAVVCRRAAALFAGIGVMLFSARNADPSVARSALVNGVMAFCALLAVLGLVELNMGNVTAAILPAVFIEIALLLAFVVERSQAARQGSFVFNEKPRR